MKSGRPDPVVIQPGGVSFTLGSTSTDIEPQHSMAKLCRQVSIESPGRHVKDCVFSFDIPVPDIPLEGARIKVICAGACYRRKRTASQGSITAYPSQESFAGSFSSTSSLDRMGSVDGAPASQIPNYTGMLDAAIFPGFEVSGIVDALGLQVPDDCGLQVGDKVVVYPYDEAPSGYAEYICVPEVQYLIKIPDSISMPVAAMLPSGALLAMNTVFIAHEHVKRVLKERGSNGKCKILVVGTGGLALWALRIARYYFMSERDKVEVTVATIRDEGIALAKENARVNIVQWNEEAYEKQLIERTTDACNGLVDIVINFGTTSRNLHRSLKCTSKGGVVFIGHETAERLMPKFSKYCEDNNQTIIGANVGTIEQLKKLVQLMNDGEIEPPPYTEFPASEAMDVIKKLCHSDIKGRAILRFAEDE